MTYKEPDEDVDESLKHNDAENFVGDYNIDANNFNPNDIECEEDNLSGNQEYR